MNAGKPHDPNRLSEEFEMSKKSLDKRFWEKVDKSGGDDGCWEWIAGKYPNGYGMFALKRQVVRCAHRVAWMLTHGDIPDGLFVLHKCDNRSCVNPSHLFLGTHKQNMQDMVNKGRNHVPKRILTDEQAQAIRDGEDGPTKIANEYGISIAFASLIKNEKRYTSCQK